MIGSLIEQLKKKFQSLTPLDSDTIFWTKGDDGITPHLRELPTYKISKPQASTPAEESTTLWALEKSGNNIISKNALALWYNEIVYQATDSVPLVWTNPGNNKNLYVDIYHTGTAWSLTTCTTIAGTNEHQYFLIGKTDESGNITQYQSGVLRIGDRFL